MAINKAKPLCQSVVINKAGPLSRADLLDAIAVSDEASQRMLAGLLGLEDAALAVQDVERIQIKTTGKASAVARSSAQLDAVNVRSDLLASPTAELRRAYWQLLAQKKREDEENPAEQQVAFRERPGWSKKPGRPEFPALMSATAIQQRLLPCLRQEKITRRIDVDELITRASRAEFLTELPLQRLRRDTQAVQIIDDRQVHLMPYWLDHSWLTWHIMGMMPEYRLSRAVIEQGESKPQSIVQHDLEDYQSPPEGSTLLLLSDLGVLAGRLSAYRRLLTGWLRRGYHIVVVTPCHVSDYPAELAAQLTLLSWEERCSALPSKVPAESEMPCKRQQWAEQLLMLCSAAVRLEPELLRSIRYALNEHLLQQGEAPLPTALESLAWQHSAVTQKHSVAATVDAQQNQQWQRELVKAPFELKQAVFAALRSWRVALPDEIWLGEFPVADRCFAAENEKPEWLVQDGVDAKNFFNYLHQRVLSGNVADSGAVQAEPTKAWLQRMAVRMSSDVVNAGSLSESIQLCLYACRDADGQIPGGHVLDPRLKPTEGGKPSLKRQSAWLCQRGNQLVVTQHDAFGVPGQRSSVLARLDYRELQLNVFQQGKALKIALPVQLTEAFISLDGTEELAADGMRIQTDLTELRLTAFKRPDWAKRIGRDRHGLFAELAIPGRETEDLVQCFRWIPAGTFMMGSPDSEPERYDDEDYHRVTITRGYWLADTAVTQAVWRTVMDNNPATFNEDNNPVEQISWDDAQQFIRRLTQKHENLDSDSAELMLRLPTEAEWEYACRAGTLTPFAFGENVNSEQVNFNGNAPYNNGKQSENRGKTTAVKSLPPNAWGFHEMHGNVWEWCADAWQEHSGAKPMVDPYHGGSDSAGRVFRGGSWISDGGFVRSACRLNGPPDGRDDGIGFRLALGHELKARSAKQMKK